MKHLLLLSLLALVGCQSTNLHDEIQFWGGQTVMIGASEALREAPGLRPAFEKALAGLNGAIATNATDRAAFLKAVNDIEKPQVRVPIKFAAAGLSRYTAGQTNAIANGMRSITEGLAAVLATP